MEKEQLPELKFSFTSDEGKAPLVSFSVRCGETDFKQLEEAIIYKTSSFKKVGFVLAALMSGFILLNIIIIAFASRSYAAAAAYIIFAVAAAAACLFPRLSVKKTARLAPNDSEYFVYSFYRHHFTFISEYEGLSLSYDNLSSAMENSLVFILFGRNSKTFLIPKKELTGKESELLHAVLENKLGSKFTVKIL
ncbi:MAG: hypothetical protein LUI05_08365 [Oscillospiraceae bacterium]|nr:hypothetical protein [Oscillospiraceae bacterium]